MMAHLEVARVLLAPTSHKLDELGTSHDKRCGRDAKLECLDGAVYRDEER